MAVRNSLMNAGNPIANAFAMEHVHPERAGDALGRPERALVDRLGHRRLCGTPSGRRSLGFDGGYAVSFITIIALYSIGTSLYWRWFHDVEALERGAGAALRPTRAPRASA